MASKDFKDDSLTKLQKKKTERKKMAEKQQMKREQVIPEDDYTFIKDWKDSLHQKSLKKPEAPAIKDSLDIAIAKRAHEREVKERQKEKTKARKEKPTEFLPAIKAFVDKRDRTLLAKKKPDCSVRNEEKSCLPFLPDYTESDNDFFSSDDDNVESLEGVFLCSLPSDNVDKVAEPVAEDTRICNVTLKFPCFSFKPNRVVFKDFEVNQIYKQKVKLINIHSSPLSCKLIGVEKEEMKNYIDLEFRPPASKQILPGMNCILVVKFSPKDGDIDLESSILMKTELGLFTIPLEIKKKFCCVSVQPQEIDFGAHVIGASSVQRFQISNHGAQTATYNIFLARTEVANGSANASSQIEFSGNNDSISNVITDPSTDQSASTSTAVSSEKKSSSTEDYDYSNNEFLIETGSQSLISPSGYESSIPIFSSSIYDDKDLIGFELISKYDGEIAGNSKVTIEISYKPQIPGRVQAVYTINTSDHKVKEFFVTVRAEALLPHVKVKEHSYDFNICAYNHLYQDNITLVNNGNKKHEISIELPKELRNHIEMQHKTGIIKPMSDFITQIKLLPRITLASDAEKYFDESTGVLEFPLSFYVSEQPLALKTTVNAIVSSTQLEFDPNVIDFGECYVNESIHVDVTMHNMGILTQHFGFIDVARCISIEPNDGFGVIFSKEELKMKIIFKPDIPMKYNSTLTCKTLFNRTFIIKWLGVGVNPPISLSHSHVNFAATHLNNISTAIIYVKNNRRDEKSWISYEFHIPDYCPIQIFPNVGQIAGGKSQKLNLIFSPKLLEQQIFFEAKNFLLDAADSEFESLAASSVVAEGIGSKNPSADELATEVERTPSHMEAVSPLLLEYRKAVDKLTCEFENRVDTFTIPCYFIDGAIKDLKDKKYQFSTMRPINLSMSCPYLKSKLKLLSSEKIDFGRIPVGKKCFSSIVICNVTFEVLKVCAGISNIQESFTLLKSKISIQPKGSGKFLLRFLPTEETDHFEKVEIYNFPGDDTLSVIVVGQSVKPKLILSFEEEEPVLNLNYAIVGDYSTVNFMIINPTEFELQLKFQFMETENEAKKLKEQSYCRNFNGLNPFVINPMQFVLNPNQSRSITVTFNPDHSHHFLAMVKLILFDNYVLRKFSLQGIGSKSQVHLAGENTLHFNPHLLVVSNINAIRLFAMEYEDSPLDHLIDDDTAVCLVFDSHKVSNRLEITFIQSNHTPVKKPPEFLLENSAAIETLGFSFDAIKGTLEIGKTTSINVKYSGDVFDSLVENATLRVKSESTVLNLTIYLYCI